MRTDFARLIFLVAAIAGIIILPAAAAIPPGATGYIAFKANIVGASVSINDVPRGMTDATGEFDIPWDPSFTSYTVRKDLYDSVTGSISFPSGAANINIPVLMFPIAALNRTGYFRIHSNLDGATVSFNGQIMGMTTNRVFTLPVPTGSNLFTSFALSKPGYRVFEAPLSRNPDDGEIIDLYATLNPVTNPTLIGGSTGYFAIHSNVEGASVSFDNQVKGQIVNGVLKVIVYTTGTPYQSYTVSANGYDTVTGSLPAAPPSGQTTDIYVTLNPTPAETTVPVGSGIGTIAVYANIEGAKVYFDNEYQGSISNGVLMAPFHVTGTPFQTYRIEAPGYTTLTGSITKLPAEGESASISVTLRVVSEPTPLPVPTTASLPAAITICAVMGVGALVLAAGSRRFR